VSAALQNRALNPLFVKGAIVARFVIDDSSLCFINCHLAAGQSHTRARNQDVAAILEDGAALPCSDLSEALPYVGGGDGSMILDHEICFVSLPVDFPSSPSHCACTAWWRP